MPPTYSLTRISAVLFQVWQIQRTYDYSSACVTMSVASDMHKKSGYFLIAQNSANPRFKSDSLRRQNIKMENYGSPENLLNEWAQVLDTVTIQNGLSLNLNAEDLLNNLLRIHTSIPLVRLKISRHQTWYCRSKSQLRVCNIQQRCQMS